MGDDCTDDKKSRKRRREASAQIMGLGKNIPRNSKGGKLEDYQNKGKIMTRSYHQAQTRRTEGSRAGRGDGWVCVPVLGLALCREKVRIISARKKAANQLMAHRGTGKYQRISALWFGCPAYTDPRNVGRPICLSLRGVLSSRRPVL